jgi:hypothetical protein
VPRPGEDDEATRVDRNVIREHRAQQDAHASDEHTSLTEVMRPAPFVSAEATIRTKAVVVDGDAPVPRATVAGRIDRGDDGPPLPFQASFVSAPPPAVDLYTSEEMPLDPLNVTGRLGKFKPALIPFDEERATLEGGHDGSAPMPFAPGLANQAAPGASGLDEPPRDPLEHTATMHQKMREEALPFDRARPKNPPRQLVPLHLNPLFVSGTGAMTPTASRAENPASRIVGIAVVVAVLLIVVMAALGSLGR